MDLIYYYPLSGGAPANVARNIFKYLLRRRKELPFENIKLFVASKYAKEMQKHFSDFEVITCKDISDISRDSLIHIPISPLIYPNSKFLLHLFAIFKKRKLILQYHGDMRKEMQLKFKYEYSLDVSYIPSYIILPYLLKSANKLIVNSYLMSNLVKSKYGLKNDIVIPNGIDDFWFDESDKTNIELDGEPNLFYHGRLSPEKGADLLLKGFSKAIGNNSYAKLYIAADGLQREYLKILCTKLGIEKNVMFLGYIGQKDVKTYLSKVDVAIYPSRFDSFSLVILEAFSSANCPVYFSKQAGIYDFVSRDGYDLNAFEPTVENIYKIVKNLIDGNYDKGIVKQQKEFARRYSWDRVINQYVGLYSQITYDSDSLIFNIKIKSKLQYKIIMRIKEIFGNKSHEILSLYSRPEAYDKMYELMPQEIYLMEHWRPIIIGIIKKYCKDKNILDLGCGTGIFTVKIKECTNNIVLGLDGNKQYLCFAKSKNKKLDLILADVHNIPLKRGTMDVIVSTGLFEYIDRGVVIKQIYEILKTDGICIISVPNKYSAGRLIGRLIHEFLGKRRGEKEPSKQEMLDLF